MNIIETAHHALLAAVTLPPPGLLREQIQQSGKHDNKLIISDIDRVGISPKQQLLRGDRMIENVHSGFIQSAHNGPPLDQ